MNAVSALSMTYFHNRNGHSQRVMMRFDISVISPKAPFISLLASEGVYNVMTEHPYRLASIIGPGTIKDGRLVGANISRIPYSNNNLASIDCYLL